MVKRGKCMTTAIATTVDESGTFKVATVPDDRPRSERIGEFLRKDYADSVEVLGLK